jgi:hypothetical protein
MTPYIWEEPCRFVNKDTKKACPCLATFSVNDIGTGFVIYACGDHVDDLKKPGDLVFRLSDGRQVRRP